MNGTQITTALTLFLITCQGPPNLQWERRPVPDAKIKLGNTRVNINLKDVRYFDNAFYALGQSVILKSTDGSDWQILYRDNGGIRFESMARGDDMFVAVGSEISGAGLIFHSPDGRDWERIPAPENRLLCDIVHAKDRYVVVGYDGLILVSTDGKKWSRQKSVLSPMTNLYGVTYGDGLFVAVGQMGSIITSPDGFHWTKRESGSEREIHGVGFGNGRFVAVTDSPGFFDARALSSPDGISWREIDTDSSDDLWSVAHGGGVFVAVGGGYYSGGRGNIDLSRPFEKGCRIYTSRNTLSWKENECVKNRPLNGIAYGNGRFVAVGYKTILLSEKIR